jgi:hypothetical protein
VAAGLGTGGREGGGWFWRARGPDGASAPPMRFEWWRFGGDVDTSTGQG